jgi:hypothetical protein
VASLPFVGSDLASDLDLERCPVARDGSGSGKGCGQRWDADRRMRPVLGGLGKGSRFMKNWKMMCAAAVACLPGVASADLDLAWDGMVAHEAIHYSLDTSVSWDAESRDRNTFAFAGLLGFNDGAFKLFCIELQQSVTHDSVSYAAGPFDGSDVDLQNRLRVLASLFSNDYDAVIESDSNAMASAFAMLTWEIMTENFTGDAGDIQSQMNFELGAVQFGDYSAEASALAAEMQARLYVANDTSGLVHYSNSEYQDFVGVPAPGVLALLGVAGVTARRRRRL